MHNGISLVFMAAVRFSVWDAQRSESNDKALVKLNARDAQRNEVRIMADNLSSQNAGRSGFDTNGII